MPKLLKRSPLKFAFLGSQKQNLANLRLAPSYGTIEIVGFIIIKRLTLH